MTPQDPLLARRIGRYEPLALLGRGGMARVYRALDHGTGREIALKVLLTPDMQHPDIAERFRREAHTLAGLRHPHIVQVYDYGEHDGITFIAEQLLAGLPLDRELRDLRQRGEHMPRERVQAAIDQLADALDYAHARNVIHRDLKPANCIRDARGDLVLTDFGIAKALGGGGSGQTRTGAILGTPAYLSPEQARGDATIGPASDVYAAGVLLFELLAGRVPFDAPQPMAVLMAHLQQPPPWLLDLRPDLPRPVALVVQRALAKDAAARYPTAGALAKALAASWSAAARATAPASTIHSQNTQVSPPPPARAQPATQPRPGSPAPARVPPPAPLPAAPAQMDTAPGGRRARSPLLAIIVALLVVGVLIFGALRLLSAAGAALGLPTAVVSDPTPALPPPEAPTEAPTAEAPPTEAPTAEAPPTEAPTAEAPPEPTAALPPPIEVPTSEPLPTIVIQPEPTPLEAPIGDPPLARAVVASMLADLNAASEQGQVEPRASERLSRQLAQLDKQIEQGNAKAARKAADDLRDDLRDGRDNDELPADLADRLLGQLDTLSLGDD